MVAGCHSKAIQMYHAQFGRLPSDEALASAHQSIENLMALTSGHTKAGGIFESADMEKAMSTTEGVMMRDRMISLILPVMLQAVTTNMVTLIPGQFNRSEMFRVDRVAGSTFGNLSAGDIIDYRYDGRYAMMDQRVVVGTGDGAAATFTLDTKTKFGTLYPLKRGSIRILHDHTPVASDLTSDGGHIHGSFTLGKGEAKETINVTGSVDYAAGTITATFSKAPAAGLAIHFGFDVDIEKDATLIPRIDHQMRSRLLVPHESAIAGNATLQALWTLRRELGLSIDSMIMSGMRNLLAADKDRKILHDLDFYAKGVVEWGYIPPESLTLREHYETLNAALLDVDSKLIKANGISGLVGIVAGTEAANVFRYLPAPLFQPAPGYRSVPQPHYVGRVFGQWDLYCNPNKEDGYSCTCFARGTEHGQTAYVAGDAVPALTFNHPVLGDLMSRTTMWELAYRDVQPFDGRDYLITFKMVETGRKTL